MLFSLLSPGVVVVCSCHLLCLIGFVLGFLACIASSFVRSLYFFCFGCFVHRCRYLSSCCFYCSGVYFSVGIAYEGLCYHDFRIPTLIPTGGVCRRRLSRFSRGPIWQRTPYGLYCDHIVVTKHCRVLTYFRTRPSRTVLTPLGSYSSCGRGVRSTCRADHRDPHPNSKVCLYETAIYGVLMSALLDSSLPVWSFLDSVFFGGMWRLQLC